MLQRRRQRQIKGKAKRKGKGKGGGAPRSSWRLILEWLPVLQVYRWRTRHAAAAAEINIYSHRQQFLLQPFLDAFTAETGIRTRVVYASKGLAQRLLAEGEASPADVILTVDIRG